MPRQKYNPPLIHTRRGAITVVCLTGFLFTMSIRVLLSYIRAGRSAPFQWPVTLNSLPSWVSLVANIALYAYLLFLGFWFYRFARGWERIVVAGWAADIVLSPLKILVSPSSVFAIRWVQTAAMGTAFIAALLLVRRPYSESNKGDTKALKRGLLIFAAVIGIMFLLGALIYFLPLR